MQSPDIPLVLTDNYKKDFHTCEVCHKAKQSRLPFPMSTTNTTSIFELVHIDIWGPYSQPSITKTNYILTLVDDFSRTTWIYLLQHKFQTIFVFTSFTHMVRTHFDTKIRSIRTDNDSEFLSSSFQKFLSDNGILH